MQFEINSIPPTLSNKRPVQNMDSPSTGKRKSDDISQCPCGCDKSSIWGCYNTNPSTLQEEIKKLKFSPSTPEFAKTAFSLHLQKTENKWVVNDNDFDSILDCLAKLKPSCDDSQLVAEFKMLEDCDLESLPARTLHYVHTCAKKLA